MAAKQASTKRTSLMLGNDSDDTQLVLKTFYSRRDEQRLESNVELPKLFSMTTQADSSGGLRFSGCVAIRKQSQGLRLNNCSHENTTKDHMIPRYPPQSLLLIWTHCL